jgi:hypothetical protein
MNHVARQAIIRKSNHNRRKQYFTFTSSSPMVARKDQVNA